jgi:hypothetical protein
MLHKPYVYTLAYPDGRVFYVGKGTGKRIDRHEQDARRAQGSHNPYKDNTIRLIWSRGEQVLKTKLALFDTHEEACLYEIALIFFMDNLTNLSIGGENAIGLSDEIENARRQKISQSMIGRAFSVETRKKISEAKKGKTQKGHAHSAVTRQKMRDAATGRVLSPACRQKLSEAKKGKSRIFTPEHKQKLKAARIAREKRQVTA